MARPVVVMTQTSCTSAVTQDVVCDPLRVGVPIVWWRIVARDGTAIPTRVELILRLGNTDYILHSGVPAAIGITVDQYLGVLFAPEAQVVARFVGATLGDVLQVTGYGEIRTPLESPVP